MKLTMTGVDHNTPIDLREKLAFTKGEVREALRILCGQGIPAVLLSTCNRTELYCESDHARDWLYRLKRVPFSSLEPVVYGAANRAAAAHLFRVAAGLESRLIGEDQILGQVKDALAMAQEESASAALLNQVFRCAISAAKEVKTARCLSNGSLTAPQRALELMRGWRDNLSGCKALVIGAGNMGRITAQLLCEQNIHVSMTRRRILTEPLEGIQYVDYMERYRVLNEAEIVVSATASPHWTLCASAVRRCNAKERVFVDLAVPRDIDPNISQTPGASLYDIDDIGGGSCEGGARAMEIWAKYETRLSDWLAGREKYSRQAEAAHYTGQRNLGLDGQFENR